MKGDDLIACYAVPVATWRDSDPLEVMALQRMVLDGLLDVAHQLARERNRRVAGVVGKPEVVPADEEPNVPVEGDRAGWLVVRQRFQTQALTPS
jgi:hypothetical protein